MAILKWDEIGKHLYETGIDRGVLYPYDKSADHPYGPGVAWNGLNSVSESPEGADETAIYADNTKYLSLRSLEEFGGTIEAYTYPDEWMECDGSAYIATGVAIGQQIRKMFGLCYRTRIGNDIDADSYGYKLHLIYGATASPSERSYETINDSPEAITFSWEFKSVPVEVGNDYKSTSIITIDSTKADKAKLAQLEEALYGKEGTEPYLPMPSEVLTMMSGT